ncbi:NfeD family protein [Oleiharenicola lentus]|nr:NfeD family protein [Oleiharenicola lentus]
MPEIRDAFHGLLVKRIGGRVPTQSQTIYAQAGGPAGNNSGNCKLATLAWRRAYGRMALMFKHALMLFPLLAAAALAVAQEAPAPATSPKSAVVAPEPAVVGPTRVYVIPVKDEISTPTVYILRRGLKEAIERKTDVVVLDMNTPGGALDKTFEIMEALDKFPGKKLTYVDSEAMSAGAFISAATDEIWFAPSAVIGAAAPVLATGGEVDKTMKQKIVSYLRARVRATSEGKGFRGQAVQAMIDEDFELKIGDKVIKPKGELLSLTATEALELYGEPPQPLLGAGKAANIEELLASKFGAGKYTVQKFQVTWSEKLAQYLNAISPVLMGLGMLALFIEFKTPGFGIFGIAGITLLAIVFLGNYVAGFSGHEPILLFAIGLILVAVELIFFPGIAIVAVSGLALMLGSMVWAMADLWPGEPISVAWSGDAFVRPLQNVGLGLALAVLLGVALLRYLPKGWVWDKMIVQTAVAGTAQISGAAPEARGQILSLVGQTGVAVTMLRPSGQVEIGGRRYEAKVEVGGIDTGEAIVVSGRTDFGLVVEKAKL